MTSQAPRFLSPDPGPVGATVLVEVYRDGKLVKVRATIKSGPNRQGLYHVTMLEESDLYLEGDPAPFYRREMEPAP